ncbi:MAG: hypothetical protein Q8R08_04980 [bacterium]|nr:hypothetical protein [bacterium]
MEINYLVSGDADKSAFMAKLAESRTRDQERLSTSIGPHHDDFEISHKGRSVVGYASRGQMRSLTLALKILEKQYLETIFKQTPLMLLDDVFSEFDPAHQQHLLGFLKTFEQVFFTTTHLEEINKFLPANSQVYNVHDGLISKVSPPARGGDKEGVGDV